MEQTMLVKTLPWNRSDGGEMSTTINDDSIEVLCKMLMDAITVNPEARLVVMPLIDTLMENNVPQEHWGVILCCTDAAAYRPSHDVARMPVPRCGIL
jgi:hypothetical protein